METLRKMHPFSIDYITGNDSSKNEQECVISPGPIQSSETSPGRTPSMQSLSPVPSECESTTSDSAESIAQALLSLDRSIKCNLSDSSVNSSEKPPHSYIALISMAILSTAERKMLLCDIYQYIMDNFSYYNNKEKAWRNSIRHNLSLNECFVKNGRSENGKGNFWSIHPACMEDFSKGDFRRRHARRRARKSMKDMDYSSDCSLNSKYNIGYIPMTSSPIGLHPYSHSMYFQHTPRHAAAITPPGTPMTSPAAFFSNPTQTFQSACTPQGWQQYNGHFDLTI